MSEISRNFIERIPVEQRQRLIRSFLTTEQQEIPARQPTPLRTLEDAFPPPKEPGPSFLESPMVANGVKRRTHWTEPKPELETEEEELEPEEADAEPEEAEAEPEEAEAEPEEADADPEEEEAEPVARPTKGELEHMQRLMRAEMEEDAQLKAHFYMRLAYSAAIGVVAGLAAFLFM